MTGVTQDESSTVACGLYSVNPGVVHPNIAFGVQGATVYTTEVSFPKLAFPGNMANIVSPQRVCTTTPPSTPP